MCWTIRPCPEPHYFSFLQTRHFCKAAATSAHHRLILGFLLTPSLRFVGLFQFPTNQAFW